MNTIRVLFLRTESKLERGTSVVNNRRRIYAISVFSNYCSALFTVIDPLTRISVSCLVPVRRVSGVIAVSVQRLRRSDGQDLGNPCWSGRWRLRSYPRTFFTSQIVITRNHGVSIIPNLAGSVVSWLTFSTIFRLRRGSASRWLMIKVHRNRIIGLRWSSEVRIRIGQERLSPRNVHRRGRGLGQDPGDVGQAGEGGWNIW